MQTFLQWLQAPLDLSRADVANTIRNNLWLQGCKTYEDFSRAVTEYCGLPFSTVHAPADAEDKTPPLAACATLALPEEWRAFLAAVDYYLDLYHKENA